MISQRNDGSQRQRNHVFKVYANYLLKNNLQNEGRIYFQTDRKQVCLQILTKDKATHMCSSGRRKQKRVSIEVIPNEYGR